jgi:hypothetical protein
VLAVVSGGQSGVEARPSGQLTDHIGLGVLAARFHRDLLEEVINQTIQTNIKKLVDNNSK